MVSKGEGGEWDGGGGAPFNLHISIRSSIMASSVDHELL